MRQPFEELYTYLLTEIGSTDTQNAFLGYLPDLTNAWALIEGDDLIQWRPCIGGYQRLVKVLGRFTSREGALQFVSNVMDAVSAYNSDEMELGIELEQEQLFPIELQWTRLYNQKRQTAHYIVDYDLKYTAHLDEVLVSSSSSSSSIDSSSSSSSSSLDSSSSSSSLAYSSSSSLSSISESSLSSSSNSSQSSSSSLGRSSSSSLSSQSSLSSSSSEGYSSSSLSSESSSSQGKSSSSWSSYSSSSTSSGGITSESSNSSSSTSQSSQSSLSSGSSESSSSSSQDLILYANGFGIANVDGIFLHDGNSYHNGQFLYVSQNDPNLELRWDGVNWEIYDTNLSKKWYFGPLPNNDFQTRQWHIADLQAPPAGELSLYEVFSSSSSEGFSSESSNSSSSSQGISESSLSSLSSSSSEGYSSSSNSSSSSSQSSASSLSSNSSSSSELLSNSSDSSQSDQSSSSSSSQGFSSSSSSSQSSLSSNSSSSSQGISESSLSSNSSSSSSSAGFSSSSSSSQSSVSSSSSSQSSLSSDSSSSQQYSSSSSQSSLSSNSSSSSADSILYASDFGLAGANGTYVHDGNTYENGRPAYYNENGWLIAFSGNEDEEVYLMIDTLLFVKYVGSIPDESNPEIDWEYVELNAAPAGKVSIYEIFSSSSSEGISSESSTSESSLSSVSQSSFSSNSSSSSSESSVSSSSSSLSSQSSVSSSSSSSFDNYFVVDGGVLVTDGGVQVIDGWVDESSQSISESSFSTSSSSESSEAYYLYAEGFASQFNGTWVGDNNFDENGNIIYYHEDNSLYRLERRAIPTDSWIVIETVDGNEINWYSADDNSSPSGKYTGIFLGDEGGTMYETMPSSSSSSSTTSSSSSSEDILVYAQRFGTSAFNGTWIHDGSTSSNGYPVYSIGAGYELKFVNSRWEMQLSSNVYYYNDTLEGEYVGIYDAGGEVFLDQPSSSSDSSSSESSNSSSSSEDILIYADQFPADRFNGEYTHDGSTFVNGYPLYVRSGNSNIKISYNSSLQKNVITEYGTNAYYYETQSTSPLGTYTDAGGTPKGYVYDNPQSSSSESSSSSSSSEGYSEESSSSSAAFSLKGDATAFGSMQTTGLSNKWLEFNSTDYLTTPTLSNVADGKCSFGIWFKTSSYASQFTLSHSTGTDRVIQSYINNSEGNRIFYRDSSHGTGYFSDATGFSYFSTDTWHHLYFTNNGAGDDWEVYIDGVKRSDGGVNIGGSFNMNNPTYWGRKSDATQIFTGQIASGMLLHDYYGGTTAADIYAQGPFVKQSDAITTPSIENEWWVD